MTVSSPVFADRSIGNRDCGQWIKEDKEYQKALSQTWLLGYMTGLNLADTQGRDSLRKVSAQQIFLWMDNFCKARPLENVSDGGHDLMAELRKK